MWCEMAQLLPEGKKVFLKQLLGFSLLRVYFSELSSLQDLFLKFGTCATEFTSRLRRQCRSVM